MVIIIIKYQYKCLNNNYRYYESHPCCLLSVGLSEFYWREQSAIDWCNEQGF
jgi:hypothetical protein